MSGYDDWDDDDEHRRVPRLVIIVAVLAASVAALWVLVLPALRDDAPDQVPVALDDTVTSATSGTTTPTSQADDRDLLGSTTTTDATTTTTSAASTTSTTARPSAGTTTSTVDDPITTVASAGPSSPPSTDPGAAAPYPTLPDGTPAPVIAIFDVDTITLSGTVPSEAAAERLKTLAIANSKFPATLVEFLAIDPDVPESVPVRVLELTSTRFPEGSSDVLPAHAAELDRVAAVMNALPNVTVLVVGHADQRGDEVRNFRLSEARAQAVVSYLVGQGISPSRLSSRAVGEADLITLADDEASLQLNRRTEFVFSGLLVGA